jgi:hypothetical protein
VTKSEYRKKVNEYKAYFLEKGMRLRIEKGDFKTNTCLVNGETSGFLSIAGLNEKGTKSIILSPFAHSS